MPYHFQNAEITYATVGGRMHIFFLQFCVFCLKCYVIISAFQVKETENTQKMEKSFIKACKG